MAFRFVVLTVFFGLLYGALGFNLYNLQVVKNNYYVKRVEAQGEITRALELRRGQIFFTDRYGKNIPAALNKDYPVVYGVPREIIDPQKTAEYLKNIFGIDMSGMVEPFSNKKSLFKLVADKVSSDQVQAVNEAKLIGIYTDTKQHRFYPFEELGAHVLGFVGLNDTNSTPSGLYGLEKLHNETLAEGDDITLTIDRNIQAQAGETLKKLVGQFNAAGGTVIVEEPATGKILALANAPDFNPNKYSEASVKNFLDSAVQTVYEPGSVFKPFTMAAGIDAGKFTPETTFYDSGSVTLNGKKITNWDHKAYGKITMTNVIENSVNTGAVYAESLEGNDVFHAFLKKLGFDTKTEIDLPDEVSGSLRNLENKNARPIDFATAAFGQGTSVTSLQLINAFGSIANGGLLMRPYLNNVLGSKVVRRVMKEETARAVTGMMESAVEKAHVASIPNYNVAGKTGTAQIPDFIRGGYTDEYIHSYVGFAPASNPRFVAMLKLERPNVTLAGQTVVPAFRELAEFILNYYNIPPDKLTNKEK